MSQPTSASVRFQDDQQGIPHTGNNTETNSRYLAPPVLPPTTSLLSAQESPSASASPSSQSAGGGGGIRAYLNRRASSFNGAKTKTGYVNANDTDDIPISPNSTPNSPSLRPHRSLVLKHRLRRINDYYEEQIQQQPPSRPAPSQGVDGSESEGGGSFLSTVSTASRGSHSTGKLDGLGNMACALDSDAVSAYAGVGTGATVARGTREGIESNEVHSTRIDMSIIDNDNGNASDDSASDDEASRLHSKKYNSKDLPQGLTITEIIRCHQPDRHLFPYRTRKENINAIKTFLVRFYFVLLIIPAWAIPIVLTAQAEHDQLLRQQQQPGEQGVTAAGAEGAVEQEVVLNKWINMLVFVLNLLAMMHLGKAAGACMEELVPKLGMRIVSVFDVMTSSSVELAVAAFALRKGMVRVAQAAMLGAILNNLLLMLGLALFVGGYTHKTQVLQADTSQTGMNLLMIVCISYVIPVTFDTAFTDLRITALPANLTQTELLEQTLVIREIVDHDILTISKIMAIIMLVLYGCCLLFQYTTRHFMVTPEAKHTHKHTVHDRHIHYWFAGFGYSIMLAAQIYSAGQLVHAVESLGKQFYLNDSFVGFILLPIVLISDLQEEVIAIQESRANRLDRSIALMIGSCMQIALLVTPLLVLLGWAIDVPMTFRFSLLEVAILTGSVLMVTYLIQDNETNWLEGCMLLAAFFMCAVAFYFNISPFEATGEGQSGASEPGMGVSAGGD